MTFLYKPWAMSERMYFKNLFCLSWCNSLLVSLPYHMKTRVAMLFIASVVIHFTTYGTRRQYLLHSKRKQQLVNLPATCSSDNFLSCFCGKRFGLHKITWKCPSKNWKTYPTNIYRYYPITSGTLCYTKQVLQLHDKGFEIECKAQYRIPLIFHLPRCVCSA